MNMISPIRQTEMPAIDVFERIHSAVQRMGDAMGIDGQFRLAYEARAGQPPLAYITHWFKPDIYAFPQCVPACGRGGHQTGSLATALDELDRYVNQHAARSTIPAIAAE